MTQDPNHPASFWRSVVVPTAVGLEAFFWRLAWFSLLVAFVYCCIHSKHQGGRHEDRAAKTVRDQAVPQQPAAE